MSKIATLYRLTINGEEQVVHAPALAAHALKVLAGLPGSHGLERVRADGRAEEIKNDAELELSGDDHFLICEHRERVALVFINRRPYLFLERVQTGSTIKARAGIPAGDVLFLNRPGEDEVITDQTSVTLHTGQRLHSSPPANYGHALSRDEFAEIEGCTADRQPDGWTWLTFADFRLNDAFNPDRATLLIKLPPGFPDAAPDMFWLHPPVSIAAGGVPQGASMAEMLGKTWQQFSWHLAAGAWVPGVSTLRDYLRCVRARLEKRN